jgi:putative GTP pyrophosphokinase
MDSTLNPNADRLLDAFAQSEPLYVALKNNLIENIGDALFKAGVKCHDIRGRIKDKSSLAEKITVRAKRAYEQLDQITDICGIRITTYFANDVDLVAKVLQDLFVVDKENSVDRRLSSDPLRFGYSSLHMVVQLPEGMASSRGEGDFARLHNLKAEVQVRSILQHAWAEIEHDLGYKSRQEVPDEVKRRFARISGLLELADDEFNAIRVQLANYSERISDPAVLQKQDLNRASLEAMFSKFEILRDIDKQIALQAKTNVTPMIPYARYLKALGLVGYTQVDQLKQSLIENRHLLTKFASIWFFSSENGKVSGLPRGVCLLFLFYFESARGRDAAKVISKLKALGIPTQQVDALSHRLLKVVEHLDDVS